MHILTINDKKEAKFLGKKTKLADVAKLSQTEIRALVQEMRITMKQADGIGLSANQVGIDMELFVAQVAAQQNGKNKFYVVANPEIIKVSEETVRIEEGCLSVPGSFGMVERPEKITIKGYDLKGKKITIKAWGMLARVFQHEIDHLKGHLFIEKAEELHDVKPK